MIWTAIQIAIYMHLNCHFNACECTSMAIEMIWIAVEIAIQMHSDALQRYAEGPWEVIQMHLNCNLNAFQEQSGCIGIAFEILSNVLQMLLESMELGH